jgi:hypothetical protein
MPVALHLRQTPLEVGNRRGEVVVDGCNDGVESGRPDDFLSAKRLPRAESRASVIMMSVGANLGTSS